MNVVYNSEAYYVVEYPEFDGYEIVSKRLARGVYLHSEQGDAFIEAFHESSKKDSSMEALDDFLELLDDLMQFPVLFH